MDWIDCGRGERRRRSRHVAVGISPRQVDERVRRPVVRTIRKGLEPSQLTQYRHANPEDYEGFPAKDPSVPISVETVRRSYLLSRARQGSTSVAEWNHYPDFG